MEWKMEWNSEHTQLQLTRTCNWRCSNLGQTSYQVYLTAEALWASSILPTVMLLYPSMVLLVDLLLLAHHQVLCSLAKPDSRTNSNSLAWKCLCEQNMMAGINAWSSVCLSSLRSLSVYLNPQSLLGLTILVAAFLNSSKYGPRAC